MTTAAPSPANALPEWVEGRRFVERLDAYRRMRKARRFGVVPLLVKPGAGRWEEPA